MARLTPEEIAAKAASRASAASGDWLAGIERVTTAPGAAAAAKKGKYLARVQERADTWAARVSAVPLTTWQQASRDKSGRFASGVAAAQGKIADFQREFQPFQDGVVNRAKQMPDDTLEQRIERARFVMTETAKFRRQR